MIIRFGDIEYFELLGLQDKLKYWGYDKLDLENLDKLRAEIDRKVKAINEEHNQRIKAKKDDKAREGN